MGVAYIIPEVGSFCLADDRTLRGHFVFDAWDVDHVERVTQGFLFEACVGDLVEGSVAKDLEQWSMINCNGQGFAA